MDNSNFWCRQAKPDELPAEGSSIEDLLPRELLEASQVVLDKSGFDVFRSPHFWESYLTSFLGGSQTPHSSYHDIDIREGEAIHRVECKFSNEYWQSYAPVHGRDWSRNVFKWKKLEDKPTVEALVLLGLSSNRTLYSWVIPYKEFPSKRRTITMCAPLGRLKTTRGPYDRFSCPVQNLKEKVLTTCRSAKQN